jgi:hypothetical protein
MLAGAMAMSSSSLDPWRSSIGCAAGRKPPMPVSSQNIASPSIVADAVRSAATASLMRG